MKTGINRRTAFLVAGAVALGLSLVGVMASLGPWGGALGPRGSLANQGSSDGVVWSRPGIGLHDYGMMRGLLGIEPGYSTAIYALSASTARGLGDAVPAGASVDHASNRISFSTSAVRLIVVGSPSGQPDETYRIAGMVNPTIEVPKGTTVHLTFINADPDMPHNLLVTRAAPPFGYGVMMQSPVAFPGAATSVLPPAAATSWPAVETSFVANATGTFTYLCTVPGHAEQGMYGRLVVKP